MTLLDKLQAHKGGLLQLKTQLYWYSRGGWDNNPGRVCLLLDAATHASAIPHAAAGTTWATVRDAAAFLLIDGQPHWVWVAEEDIERL